MSRFILRPVSYRLFSGCQNSNSTVRFNSSWVTQHSQEPRFIDSRSWSKQLSDYLKCGDIGKAQQMFDEMPDRDVVTWSIMVHGYAKNGLNRESLKLFSTFRHLGCVPNSFTLVGALVAVAGRQELALAKLVHGLGVTYGLVSNSFVATAMVDAYLKCGGVSDAYKLFRMMDSPSVVSYNALLAGMTHNEMFEEAVRVFLEFRRFGFVPNAETMLTLIQACAAQESQNLCESVHALVLKVGLLSKQRVNNSLLGMYSSLRDPVAAEMVFNEMESRDVISWTSMIGLLNELDCASNAISLFHQMVRASVEYDTVTIVNLLGACSSVGDLRKGKQAHAHSLVCGYSADVNVLNSIISMYAKCDQLRLSRAVFNHATKRSFVSWSALISGYAQNGQPMEAVNLLIKLRTEYKCCFNLVNLLSALKASGELAVLELTRQLHTHSFTAGFSGYREVLNSLISAYSKCGNVELAHDVFREMGDLRHVVSWNAILNGYGINGHGELAVCLFYKMLNDQVAPDSTTYLGVLSACSHSGLVVDGLKIFEQMIEVHQITPNQELVGCMVDLLARAGSLSDVGNFVSRFLCLMGMSAWKALLSGCLVHGNTEMAEFVAKTMIERDPGNADTVVLLSNIFASSGRYGDAEALRLSIGINQLMKNPGISLLNGVPSDHG